MAQGRLGWASGEGTLPRSGTRTLAVLVFLAPAALAPASAPATTPAIESVRIDGDAIADRTGDVRVRTADPEAPVSGLTLALDGGSFGSSACRLAGPGTPPIGAPFSNGSPVVLSAPHHFGPAGMATGVARIDSGGCAQPTGSVAQPFTVTVTEPGEPTEPLLLETPIPLLNAPGDVPDIPGLDDLPPITPLGGLLPAAAATPHCEGARARPGRSKASRDRAREAVYCLMNYERKRRGLRPLEENNLIVNAATAHSGAMVRRGFFSHFGTRPPGRRLTDRLRRSRYLPARRFLVGENLAFANGRTGKPALMMRAWMRSTPHRVNILERKFREVGVGVKPGIPVGARGITYTVDFGVRR